MVSYCVKGLDFMVPYLLLANLSSSLKPSTVSTSCDQPPIIKTSTDHGSSACTVRECRRIFRSYIQLGAMSESGIVVDSRFTNTNEDNLSFEVDAFDDGHERTLDHACLSS